MGKLMMQHISTLDDLHKLTENAPPLRVGVVCAEEETVLETVRSAQASGLIEPLLIGDPALILQEAEALGLDVDPDAIAAAWTEQQAAETGASLLSGGAVDTLMKGHDAGAVKQERQSAIAGPARQPCFCCRYSGLSKAPRNYRRRD